MKKERENGEMEKIAEDDERRSCCVILNIKTDMLIYGIAYSIIPQILDLK